MRAAVRVHSSEVAEEWQEKDKRLERHLLQPPRAGGELPQGFGGQRQGLLTAPYINFLSIQVESKARRQSE